MSWSKFATVGLLAAAALAWTGPVTAGEAAGQVMTREKFEDYLSLFSRGDHRYADYYDPDVVFDARPAPAPLHGRKAILDLYDGLHKQLTEQVTAGTVVIDNAQGVMMVELTNRIVATQDNVKLPSGTMNKGDVSLGSGVMIYGLRNGRIVSIREAKSGRAITPAKK